MHRISFIINKSMYTCKHCKEKFDTRDKPKGWQANHSRWCDQNPKSKYYRETLKITHKTRKTSNQFIDAKNNGLPTPTSKLKGRINKAWLGKNHSIESKKKMSQSARNSKHRRLQRNIIEYNGLKFDSSWEVALAKRLDQLGENWIRPKPIIWYDKDGKNHNYFPDFYLPERDIYLDPKGPHVVNVQKEKLIILLNTYDNILILQTLEQCKNFNVPFAPDIGLLNRSLKLGG